MAASQPAEQMRSAEIEMTHSDTTATTQPTTDPLSYEAGTLTPEPSEGASEDRLPCVLIVIKDRQYAFFGPAGDAAVSAELLLDAENYFLAPIKHVISWIKQNFHIEKDVLCFIEDLGLNLYQDSVHCERLTMSDLVQFHSALQLDLGVREDDLSLLFIQIVEQNFNTVRQLLRLQGLLTQGGRKDDPIVLDDEEEEIKNNNNNNNNNNNHNNSNNDDDDDDDDFEPSLSNSSAPSSSSMLTLKRAADATEDSSSNDRHQSKITRTGILD